MHVIWVLGATVWPNSKRQRHNSYPPFFDVWIFSFIDCCVPVIKQSLGIREEK